MNINLKPAIVIFMSIVLFCAGCKKDNDEPNDTETPITPGVMMTFSSIAYVAEGHSDNIIKDSIVYFLGDTSLTTKGQWELAWGPGISTYNENLVYVAKKTSGTPVYVIAIRGTNINSISDIVEDFDIFKMVEFPYGTSGDSVTHGAMVGFNKILDTRDPETNSKLEDFLLSLQSDAKIPLCITGHSQGGGLAPLMSYWLMNNEKAMEKFTFSTYAFARPGFVNKNFRDNFLAKLPADASYSAYVNSLDMIPYGYSNLHGIIKNSVPVKVPLVYQILISIADDLLKTDGLYYYNIVVADTIGFIPVTNDGFRGVCEKDSLSWYNHWLMEEHKNGSYLKLLDAEPLY